MQDFQSPLQSILQTLNPAQLKAVKHINGAQLILAGAGSGKTKTLTTRLVYLIEEVGIPPNATLTLTFTNKAAKEMRERSLQLLSSMITIPPLLCTFHKFGLLFLRFHIKELGRQSNFTLLDSTDCKRILKKLNPNIPSAYALAYISNNKNAFISADEAKLYAKTPEAKKLQKIYHEYETQLINSNMLDFDDLLYLSCKILEANPALCQEQSQKYQYIMVDEYQDTNKLQYQLLRYLTSTHQNICVVGDDDQSIYSWRGANINNILDFTKYFQGAHTIKLELNYRSSPKILHTANTLIEHNAKRLGKELRSCFGIQGQDEDVELLDSIDEISEGNLIASIIKEKLQNGAKPEDFVVLFRLNALSRSIEEAFNRAKIPYRIIGTMRFYEREEIKDLLSYLRFMLDPHDDFSLLRILNKPKRGIGRITQERIESLSTHKNKSITEIFIQHKEELLQAIGAKNVKKLEEFFGITEILREKLKEGIEEFLCSFEQYIDFTSEFSKSQSLDKMANIAEFYGLLREWAKNSDGENLNDFLNDLSLDSNADEDFGESVSCMSIHTAKGLEFECVFVIGLEEGFFPLILNDSELEEERRLAYVAITRAKKKLYLSSVKSRFYKGKREILKPSRFFKESGLDRSSLDANFQNSSSQEAKDLQFSINDMVTHKLFGFGRVEEVSNTKAGVVLKINFGGVQRIIRGDFVKKA